MAVVGPGSFVAGGVRGRRVYLRGGRDKSFEDGGIPSKVKS